MYIKWSTGQDSMFYVCTDRQGSITALLKQTGAVSERYSYDAYGRRRNPANWADYNVKAPRLIARGYTGHEHLDGFGLINMNGRMYDPVIGRVLSPDKIVQAPGYTQSYNRYSYCMNNPLKYTDPSGWYMSDATHFGRDIIDMSGRGTTFYDWGVGSPGNYFSGRGSNTSIGPQGYTYVGGGVYMDVATGKGVDFGTVFDNSLAQEQVGFITGSVAREFVDRINSGFRLYSYQLYDRTNWVLSVGNPGLYAAIGGGYKTLNPTAGSYVFGGVITNAGSGGSELTNEGITLQEAGSIISTFGAANSVKTILVEWGMKGADWGKAGTRYMKVLSRTGIAGSVFGMGVSGFNMYNDFSKGGIEAVNGLDVLDFGVGATSLGATIFLVSNPVGWIIAGSATIYFGARLIYDISSKPLKQCF